VRPLPHLVIQKSASSIFILSHIFCCLTLGSKHRHEIGTLNLIHEPNQPIQWRQLIPVNQRQRWEGHVFASLGKEIDLQHTSECDTHDKRRLRSEYILWWLEKKCVYFTTGIHQSKWRLATSNNQTSFKSDYPNMSCVWQIWTCLQPGAKDSQFL